MDPSALAENKACEAVIAEMRAWFDQHDAPEVATELLVEAESRIALRRIRAQLEGLSKPKEGASA